jgi:uncharacterized delta-60 repeat protein
MTTRSLRLLLLACASLMALASTANAAPADVDASFGNGGVLTLPATVSSGRVANANQADGKLLVGYTRLADDVAELMRLNPNGSLDPSFGGDGIAAPPLPGATETWVASVTPLASGRIIVAGTGVLGGVDRMIVWALTPSGELDTTFNAGVGYRILPAFGTDGNFTAGAVVQPDGDIAMIASVTTGGIDGVVFQIQRRHGSDGGGASARRCRDRQRERRRVRKSDRSDDEVHPGRRLGQHVRRVRLHALWRGGADAFADHRGRNPR